VSWDIASRIIIALVGLMGVAWQVRRAHGGTLKSIKEELDIYSLLPDESPAKKLLLDRAEAAIVRHLSDEMELRRDPYGMALALFLLTSGAVMTLLVFTDQWSWLTLIPAAIFLIFGVAGLHQDAVPRKRDENGRPIEE
jgi:uncharacterized membrane protein YqjE